MKNKNKWPQLVAVVTVTALVWTAYGGKDSRSAKEEKEPCEVE